MFSGFGILPAASWRGQRGREDLPLPHSVCASSLQEATAEKQRRAAARFFTSSMPIASVQNVNVRGAPTSALSGLWPPSSWGEDSPEDVCRRDVAVLSTQLSKMARERKADLNPGIQYAAEQLAAKGSPDCKTRVDELKQMLSAVINDLRMKGGVGGTVDINGTVVNRPPMALPQIPGVPPDTSKYLIIGGIVLGGVLLLSVVGGVLSK